LFPPTQHHRIVVVGTTGSGKTTLARQLAQRLGVPHVELDALHWEPGWTEAPTAVFRQRVAEALKGNSWVVDGNYHTVRDIVWSQANLLVWLDYRLAVLLWRLWRRTIVRHITRKELWNGNRESFRTTFLSRESILLWQLQSYRRRRREYPQTFALPEYSHLRVVRLRSPGETRRWLEGSFVPPAFSRSQPG
jgi:adenylate kinase family enzyme